MATPVTVTVGALVAADDDAVCATQKAAGSQYLVINGAKGDGTTANNICQSQTPGGAGTLTINGTLATGGVAYMTRMRRIYITSAGNDSGRTFTIVGTGYSPAGVYGISETVTGANTSIVGTTAEFFTVTSITISGAAAAAVTVGAGGLATLDTARRIIVTSAGNDSGITFTLTGTDWANTPISEVLTGANATAATSVLNYKTVTSVKSSAAVATTVIVGTTTTADSPWVRFDDYASNAQTAVAAVVSGTVNYSIQLSMDDPNALGSVTYGSPSSMTWLNSLDADALNVTTSKVSYFEQTPLWARVHLNSGTGSVVTTFRQAYTG